MMDDWIFVIVLLMILMDNPRKVTVIKSEFILDIGKRFSSLWMIGEGGYGKGKYQDTVFRIQLRARGIGSTKPRMIRG
jgi:hypothetical protein